MKWFGSWVSDKVCVIVHGAMIGSSGGGMSLDILVG